MEVASIWRVLSEPSQGTLLMRHIRVAGEVDTRAQDQHGRPESCLGAAHTCSAAMNAKQSPAGRANKFFCPAELASLVYSLKLEISTSHKPETDEDDEVARFLFVVFLSLFLCFFLSFLSFFLSFFLPVLGFEAGSPRVPPPLPLARPRPAGGTLEEDEGVGRGGLWSSESGSSSAAAPANKYNITHSRVQTRDVPTKEAFAKRTDGA